MSACYGLPTRSRASLGLPKVVFTQMLLVALIEAEILPRRSIPGFSMTVDE
jgi:hypothetical protein